MRDSIIQTSTTALSPEVFRDLLKHTSPRATEDTDGSTPTRASPYCGRPIGNPAVEARIAAKKRWAQSQARRRRDAQVNVLPYSQSSGTPDEAVREHMDTRQLPLRTELPVRRASVSHSGQQGVPALPLSSLLTAEDGASLVPSSERSSQSSDSSLILVPVTHLPTGYHRPVRPAAVSMLPPTQLENPVVQDGSSTNSSERSAPLRSSRRDGRGGQHPSLLSRAWSYASPEAVATVVTGVAVAGVAYLSYRSLSKGSKLDTP